MNILIESSIKTISRIDNILFSDIGKNGYYYCYQSTLDYSEKECIKIKNAIEYNDFVSAIMYG